MAGLKAGYPLGGCKTPGLQLFAGSFETDAGNAPVNVRGAGFSVVRATTGNYTVTLTDGPFNRVIYASASLEEDLTSTSKLAMVLDAQTLTSTKSFTILTQSAAGTAADLNGPRVNFLLLLQSTPVAR